MRKPEQRLWDSMRRAHGSTIHLERIENAVGTGIPDVLSLDEGWVVFCELKVQEDIPTRASTPLLGKKKGLNTDQLNWHLNWTKRGGNSLIIVRIGVASNAKVYAFAGSKADSVNSLTADSIESAADAVGWYSIGTLLRHYRNI